MAFVQNPKIKKITMKERWISVNKAITRFFKIHTFLYFVTSKPVNIANYVRSLQGYEEAKTSIINTTLTGLLIGLAIWSWRTGNSFLLGISIAITLVITENYIIWFKETFRTEKKK